MRDEAKSRFLPCHCIVHDCMDRLKMEATLSSSLPSEIPKVILFTEKSCVGEGDENHNTAIATCAA